MACASGELSLASPVGFNLYIHNEEFDRARARLFIKSNQIFTLSVYKLTMVSAVVVVDG